MNHGVGGHEEVYECSAFQLGILSRLPLVVVLLGLLFTPFCMFTQLGEQEWVRFENELYLV